MLIYTSGLLAQGKRILFLGDSITDGNWGGGGVKSSSERNHWDQNHLFGSGFMYLSAAFYMGGYPEYKLEFFNRGISGNTLDDLSKRWQEDVLDIKPDVVSILIGTNDIAQFVQSEKKSFDYALWSQTYATLIQQTLEKYPDVRIVLCTPFVARGERVKDERYVSLVTKLSVEVRQLATAYGVTVVDFHALFAELENEHPRVASDYWLWDGVHPTAAAHQKMAELWRSVAGEYVTEHK
ncbi:MAG: SGNH/GDSL hydrolase family protein [Sphingobacterium sp.]|uniref:SGNH/GDSL hydrolase family protein n=1 Tax=Sphingobacterium sp. JB170 TaxID=1434842 RepID=UPI00097F5A39|nr:SGNH/GDSL hydrolase family protein [Sphingobacterium sp. JB170]SJN44656.1 lipase/acylhydrolase family protein [Sphingobacterium sp. JB170]